MDEILTLARQRLKECDRDFYVTLNLNMNVKGAMPKRANVPVYKMIERFLKIKDKNGRIIPFILNADQIELYKEICLQRRLGLPVRIDILKARQIGFSTFIAGIIFIQTLFNTGQSAIIVADTAEHAGNLFEKYNTFYEHMPLEFKKFMPKVKSNARELVVKYDDGITSSIRITVEGDNAGRSATAQCLHLSECAFWKKLRETNASLLSVVPYTNADTFIFYETTANGVNEYKDMYDVHNSGDSIFKALFYAWWSHEEYSLPWNDTIQLEQWEIDLQQELNLPNDKIAWYHAQYLNFSKDKDKLRQEYPSNPVEAFVTSGNSVFNAELVQKRKVEILQAKNHFILKRGFFTFNKEFSIDGSHINMTNVKWLDNTHGEIKIYEEPKDGVPYVVNNDPAMGGEDYFVIQVINNNTLKQAAVYRRNKCDADDCAYQMYCLGIYYNNALISGETNTTSYLLAMVQKMGYPFIYQDQDIEDLSTHYLNKLGYKTKTNNRQYMIDMFKIAFREDYQMIYDYDTICEMEAFQVVRNNNTNKEKIEAAGNGHDDLVMAMCGIFICRNMQTTIPIIKKTQNQSYEFEPFHTPDIKPKFKKVFQIWD